VKLLVILRGYHEIVFDSIVKILQVSPISLDIDHVTETFSIEICWKLCAQFVPRDKVCFFNFARTRVY
jgi:hypothetical protein